MLKTVTAISNSNRVAKIFYPDLIDGDVAVIRLALDVFHKDSLLQKVFRFYMTHGSKNVSLDFFITTVKLLQHKLYFATF
jgi:hypothetical protein